MERRFTAYIAVRDAPIVTIGRLVRRNRKFRRIKSVILFRKFITGLSVLISASDYLMPLIAIDWMMTFWNMKNRTRVGIIAITDAAIINA